MTGKSASEVEWPAEEPPETFPASFTRDELWRIFALGIWAALADRLGIDPSEEAE